MINRQIVTHQYSIRKLQDTSLLPWEDVLETSDFFTDIDRESQTYNKANTNLQLKYARMGLKNLKKRDEAKKKNEDDTEATEEIDPELSVLSSDGLTVEQVASKETELEELLNREVKKIELPSIDIKVIKKLYEDSKSRREKEIQNAGKKEEKKPAEGEEPYFTTDDVRAYIVLGITKKPAKKKEE